MLLSYTFQVKIPEEVSTVLSAIPHNFPLYNFRYLSEEKVKHWIEELRVNSAWRNEYLPIGISTETDSDVDEVEDENDDSKDFLVLNLKDGTLVRWSIEDGVSELLGQSLKVYLEKLLSELRSGAVEVVVVSENIIKIE